MLFYSDIIWIVILAAAIGAGIAFLVLRTKGGVAGSDENGKFRLPDGIKDNALAFSEMYEPMYSVSAGKTAKQEEVFAAWNEAVEGCGDEEFAKAFADKFGDYSSWGVTKKGQFKVKTANKIYSKKSRKLVKYFFKAGIVREGDITVCADETTAEKYEIVGGSIVAGNTYEVLAPYWHLGNDIVDKGVIR